MTPSVLRTRPPRVKVPKPYPDFPLFAHATGRWAKKIGGRFHFFGPVADPHGALERWLASKDELLARARLRLGPSAPRAAGVVSGGNGTDRRYARASSGLSRGVADALGGGPDQGTQLRDVLNRFLTAKQRRVENEEMTRRSFAEYHAAGTRLVEAFGADRLVETLGAEDFGRLRQHLAKTRGPVALSNEIGRVRSIFKFAFEAGMLDRPVRFGPEFMKPTRHVLRRARAKRGERMFEPGQIRALADAAGVQLKAMILLGINCGMGNTDVAALREDHLNLKARVVDFPRPKTGIERRGILWPETVAAIRAALAVRPRPAKPADADRVFLTAYGHPWVRVDAPKREDPAKPRAIVKDGVSLAFWKLVKETGLYREGRGFYALRHTFRTVADESGDRRAIDRVMGHESPGDISVHYVERVADERLAKIGEHVHAWLYPQPS